MNEAKNAGQLGFAGILVWMRFMATRQLVWNKNYNVKPRYSSKNVISNLISRFCPHLQKIPSFLQRPSANYTTHYFIAGR